MEPSAYPTDGGVALPLFRVEGAVLPIKFEPCGGACGSDKDESCEELEPNWKLGSTPITGHHLAGGVLAPER